MISPADANVKVWSVIVTLFGDLAANKGDEISGSCLSGLMEQLGFRADATRVALHRLRKDGWIEVRKEGRQAFYSLSEFGLRETEDASPRIYQAPSENSPIAIFTMPPNTQSSDAEAITASLFASFKPPKDAWLLSCDHEQMPDWVKQNIVASTLMAAFSRLEHQLSQMPSPELGPQEIAAQRVTIIHPWRRLILRVSEVSEILLGDGPVTSCRKQVEQSLAKWPHPTLVALHEEV